PRTNARISAERRSGISGHQRPNNWPMAQPPRVGARIALPSCAAHDALGSELVCLIQLRVVSSSGLLASGSVIGDLDDEFADVRPVEEHVDRGRELLEALNHGFEHLQFACGKPTGKLRDGVPAPVEVVEDDETLQPYALSQQHPEIAQARWRLDVVVGGN